MKNIKQIFIYTTLTLCLCSPGIAEPNIPFILKSELDSGVAYLQEGNFQDAITIINKVINTKSDYAAAHLYLGFCYLKTGQTTQAINELQMATKLAPNDIDIYGEYLLGSAAAYLTLEETDTAISLLKDGLKKLNDYPQWLEKINFSLGNIYYDNNEIYIARNYWQNAINTGYKATNARDRYYETNKQAARLLCLEGQKYLKAGKYEFAVDVLNTAVEFDSSELLYTRILEEAVLKDKAQKEYDDIVNRINKAKKHLINGQYYNAFCEYRVIKNTKLTLTPYLWKTIGQIGYELSKKGYVVQNYNKI